MPLNLSHLKTCAQDWDSMSPTERGRLCAACRKDIIDFRGMTDLEIARTHASSETPVCGLYSEAQLSAGKPNRIGLAASLALSLVLGQRALQAQTAKTETDKDPSTIADRVSVDTLIVRGVLLDSVSRRPLPGAVIMLRGTQRGTITDANGRFQLEVPSEPGAAVPLRAMLIGYAAKDLDVPAVEAANELTIILSESIVAITAFIVTGVPQSRTSRMVQSIVGTARRITDIAKIRK